MHMQHNVPFFTKKRPQLPVFSQKFSFQASKGPKGGAWVAWGGETTFFQ